MERPFYAVIETPGRGNVIQVVNTAPFEFPLIATVEAYSNTNKNEKLEKDAVKNQKEDEIADTVQKAKQALKSIQDESIKLAIPAQSVNKKIHMTKMQDDSLESREDVFVEAKLQDKKIINKRDQGSPIQVHESKGKPSQLSADAREEVTPNETFHKHNLSEKKQRQNLVQQAKKESSSLYQSAKRRKRLLFGPVPHMNEEESWIVAEIEKFRMARKRDHEDRENNEPFSAIVHLEGKSNVDEPMPVNEKSDPSESGNTADADDETSSNDESVESDTTNKRKTSKKKAPWNIDLGKLGSQQIMDAPVAKAATHLRNIDDRRTEHHGLLIRHWRVTVTTASEPHKTARSALRQIKLLDDLPDGFTSDLWG